MEVLGLRFNKELLRFVVGDNSIKKIDKSLQKEADGGDPDEEEGTPPHSWSKNVELPTFEGF